MGKGGKGGVRVVVKQPKGMPSMEKMKEMQAFDPMKEMMSSMMTTPVVCDYPMPARAQVDQIKWPERSTGNVDVSKWITVYPNYLDSTKSTGLGRRSAAAHCVPSPPVDDLHEALMDCSIRHVVEPNKKYPRDPESHWYTPGRVLVELFSAVDGDPVHPEANNKLQLLKLLAETIVALPGRDLRVGKFNLEESKRREAKEAAIEAEQKLLAEQKPATKADHASSGAKKKGKKKK
jgi:signal recognition particle subunit SRP19